MNHQSDQLIGIISAVRKRRNLLIVLRGLAIAVATMAAMLVIAALAAYRFASAPPRSCHCESSLS
jgi:hypothetical protein